MSPQSRRAIYTRITCPYCQKEAVMSLSNVLQRHGADGKPCPGVGQKIKRSA